MNIHCISMIEKIESEFDCHKIHVFSAFPLHLILENIIKFHLPQICEAELVINVLIISYSYIPSAHLNFFIHCK